MGIKTFIVGCHSLMWSLYSLNYHFYLTSAAVIYLSIIAVIALIFVKVEVVAEDTSLTLSFSLIIS